MPRSNPFLPARILLGLTLFGVAVCDPLLAQAATLYVATPQSVPAGNDATGNGTAAKPYATIAKALSQAAAGDLVSIGDGTYATGQLIIPPEVSLASTSQNSRRVKITVSQNLNMDQPLLVLDSPAPGSSGNQNISHLEISGVNGSWVARNAIRIKNRSQVKILYCHIHDFNGAYGACGIRVYSSYIPFTIGWEYFWPADVQPPGTDTQIEAGIQDGSVPYLWYANMPDPENVTPKTTKYAWPLYPVENIEIASNTLTACGYKGTVDQVSGAIEPYNVKNASIHDNLIDCSGPGIGQAVYRTAAFLWNTRISNNRMLGQVFSDRSTYLVEVWLTRGCQIDNNVCTDGGFSITYGKETHVFSNSIRYLANNDRGIGIEFIGQSYGSLYKNYVDKAPVFSTDAGMGVSGAKNWLVTHTAIYNNVFYQPKHYAIEIVSHGNLSASCSSTVSNITIYNNVIHGTAGRPGTGIHLFEDASSGAAVVDGVDVKNNIFYHLDTRGGYTQGGCTHIVVTHNQFYSVPATWLGATPLESQFTDPLFINPGVDYAGYALHTSPVASPCIDSGVDVDLPFNGSAPDRGAIETSSASPPPLAPRGLTIR